METSYETEVKNTTASILGSEEDIRLAVLSDEVELCEQRLENNSDSIPHLGYMLFTLKSRIKELKGL